MAGLSGRLTRPAGLRCDVVLLVVCPRRQVAAWCAKPIRLGHPGFELRPLVAGPDVIPIIDNPVTARADPELAVLSALAHPADPVVEAMADGLEALDPPTAVDYTNYVLALLPAAAKKHLEDLLATQTFTYSSPFTEKYVDQGRAEGEAKGEAKALLAVLLARGIDVPDDARARITACTDLDLLEAWVRRSVTIDSIDELFD